MFSYGSTAIQVKTGLSLEGQDGECISQQAHAQGCDSGYRTCDDDMHHRVMHLPWLSEDMDQFYTVEHSAVRLPVNPLARQCWQGSAAADGLQPGDTCCYCEAVILK